MPQNFVIKYVKHNFIRMDGITKIPENLLVFQTV